MSRRSLGLSAALVVGGFAALPGSAQAQLFPNLPIRRQRVEPTAEAPFYSHVRQTYYGYYPTCWQKFPEGWACPCPNPELPDTARAFRERPRDKTPDLNPTDPFGPLPEPGDGDTTPPAGAGAGAPRGGNAPAGRGRPSGVPPLPNGSRSPFELDTRRPTDPGAGAGAATDPAAPGNPDLSAPSDAGRLRDAPRTNDSPPPAGAPGSNGTRPMPPARGTDPPLSPSTSNSTPKPPKTSLPEISMDGPSVGSSSGGGNANGRPLLEMPPLSAPSGLSHAPTEIATSLQPFPSSLPTGNGPSDDSQALGSAPRPAATSADPSAKRPSMISGFLGGLNRRRR